MVKEYKTTTSRIKGKLCHFTKDDFVRHGLLNYYWVPVDKINFEELRNTVYNILQKEGFVFFNETPEYKYISKFGNLAEFAIQFHHIL